MDPASAPALATYETLAPVYDDFSADYDHEGWFAALEAAAEPYAPPGRRALDVGCGTGKSALPLVRRGCEVSACDLSPAMVDEARDKPGLEDAFTADMRDLPDCGSFELVTCLDDAVNYLLAPDDLRRTAEAVARLLVPGGLYVFDVNTLGTYRGAFADSAAFSSAGTDFAWEGATSPHFAPGGLAHAGVTARGSGGAVRAARHVQRHRGIPEVTATLRAAGLEPCVVLGQTTGAVLHRTPDELAHAKVVFVARKPSETPGGGARMTIKP